MTRGRDTDDYAWTRGKTVALAGQAPAIPAMHGEALRSLW